MNSAVKIALIAAMLVVGNSQAQVVEGIATGTEQPLPKPARGWNLHAGYTYAVINNRYEVKGQYKSGLNAGLVFRFGQWFAIEAMFSRYQRHTATSLDDIQAWTADLNGQLSMRIGQSDLYFRTVFGAGYVDWKGYYVGPNLNDNYHYYIGKLLNDKFYTGNLGCGFSHYFFRQRLEGFGDFRLRVAGDRRVLFTISDTQFIFGMRYALVNKSKPKDKVKENQKDGDASKKPNHDKRRKVYKWLKNR